MRTRKLNKKIKIDRLNDLKFILVLIGFIFLMLYGGADLIDWLN